MLVQYNENLFRPVDPACFGESDRAEGVDVSEVGNRSILNETERDVIVGNSGTVRVRSGNGIPAGTASAQDGQETDEQSRRYGAAKRVEPAPCIRDSPAVV
jgi:hypothetical protein